MKIEYISRCKVRKTMLLPNSYVKFYKIKVTVMFITLDSKVTLRKTRWDFDHSLRPSVYRRLSRIIISAYQLALQYQILAFITPKCATSTTNLRSTWNLSMLNKMNQQFVFPIKNIKAVMINGLKLSTYKSVLLFKKVRKTAPSMSTDKYWRNSFFRVSTRLTQWDFVIFPRCLKTFLNWKKWPFKVKLSLKTSFSISFFLLLLESLIKKEVL